MTKRERSDDGFTLIEVSLVVLIIAILLVIAIPAFLGAKTRSNDRAVQSNLRNALTNAKTIYADTDSYEDATAAELAPLETSLAFTAGSSVGAKLISVFPSSDGIVLTAMSGSGTCYVVGDTGTGVGTVFTKFEAGTCDASTVTPLPTAPVTIPAPTADGVWARGW